MLPFWGKGILVTWLVFFIGVFCWSNEALAIESQLTSQNHFAAGTYSGIDVEGREGEMKLEADGSWVPRIWKTPDLTMTDGGAITSNESGTYLLAGHDVLFYRYSPSQNKWKRLADAPGTAYLGADMVTLGDYIYVEFGGYQKIFARYSINLNRWEMLAEMPDWVQSGASLQTDGENIFAIRGAGNYDFWQYSIIDNSWISLTYPPVPMAAGSDLIFDDSTGTDYLYTPRGGNQTSFHRYNITLGLWTTLAPVPGTMYDVGNMEKIGGYIYMLRGYNTANLYRYNLATNVWETLPNTPWTTRYLGLTYNQEENLLYVFRGNGSYDWWKYDIGTSSYLGGTELPGAPGSGADLVYLNGNVYYRRGNNSTSFYKMTIGATGFDTLGTLPATVNDDNKGVAANGKLYYFRGGSTNTFWQYDPSGVGWSGMLNAPATVAYGASIVYPGGDYLYATRGGMSRTFWRYKIGVGETWEDTVATDLPVGSEVGYGSRLVSDGTDIYMVAGQGISNFLKYSIGTTTWTVLGQAPFAPYWGTDLIYHNGKIYAQGGFYKTEMWEYDISQNQWRLLPKFSGTYSTDVGPYNGGSITIDSVNGVLYSISGQNIVNLWSYQLSSYDYKHTGVWVSEPIDLRYVSSFNQLETEATSPDGTTISWYSRTSATKNTWSAWSKIESGVIASPPERYVQLKATMISNVARDLSPTINSVTVDYNGDVTAPSNVSAIVGLSQSVGGTVISSGSTYTYNNPKFSWGAVTDEGEGAKGYYVYFGASNTANPVDEGYFQTDTDMVVTLPMGNGVYYLRIVTEDLAGNKSEPETKFIYAYNGVLPLGVGVSGQSSLVAGVGSSVTVSNGQIKLESRPGFWEQKRVSLAPNTFRYGASFAYVAERQKLYTFRGNNTNSFYEYDVALDLWTTLPNAPAAVYIGGELVEGPDGYLYGMPGQNTNVFWRYEIGTSTWSDEAAANAPLTFYYGSSIVYDGSQYIYVLRGNSDDALMRYDTVNNTWENLANVDFGAPIEVPNNNVYVGADMVFDGETLYAIQGNLLSGFAGYNISQNSWTVLPKLPVLPYEGAQIVYDDKDRMIYYISGWYTPLMYRYDIGNQTWERMPDAPSTFSGGSAVRKVGRELYVLRGGSTNVMWVYNLDKRSWLAPTRGLFGPEFRGSDSRQFGYGAQIVKGEGDDYYMTRGNYDNLFIKYNSNSGEVTKLANAPGGYYTGSAMTYVPSQKKIYSIISQYIHQMWIYDLETNNWSLDTGASLPITVSNGSSIEYDGVDKIYWIPGGGRVNFYVYDLGSTAANKWSARQNVPGAVGYGSHLTRKNGYIYTLRGNNVANNSFYRFNIGTTAWETITSLPIDVYNDGTLVNAGGDYMIACKAENTALCYRYSVGGGSWESIVNAPANIYMGGAAASDGEEKMLLIAGNGAVNTYNNGLYSYVLSNENTSFASSGNYTGEVVDLGDIYRFASLDIDYDTNYLNTFTVETRTSDDGINFNDWSQATEEKVLAGGKKKLKVNSAVKRYAQIKITLLSDNGIHTPKINGYRFDYYRDELTPSNPGVITALSAQTSGVSITEDGWHNFSLPYFDWPEANEEGGASDGANGSGIDGYYVYFGTEADSTIEEDEDSWVYTTNSYFAPTGLVSGSQYYLKIRAKDDAGKMAEASWQAFVYRFDNVKPINPSTVTVDPPGYTANNSFNISWIAGTDDVSGIASYCYKFSQVGATEVCTTDVGVSGIMAYKTGTNTLMIRAKDNASNFANDYTTVSYYFSDDAPGAPRNLRVTPENNSINEFAFAWDPPDLYYGQQAALRYYYSINTPPQASNVNQVGLATTYLSTGAWATQKGTNILYVVSKDEAGNIDYQNYAQVQFEAETEAPGVPEGLDISDVSIKETKSWRLALSWDAPEASGSGVAKYKVYRSRTAGAVCTNDFSDFSYVAETTQVSYVDTGLTAAKTFYCIKACDSTNECSAPSGTVSMLPDGRWRVAPSLEAEPSAVVKTKSAVIDWVTSRTASSFVKYGKESGNYGEEVGSSDQLINHVINLIGLDPGTSYYYKVLWTDEDGNTGESEEKVLTTNPAPVVSTVKVSDVSMYSVYVNFALSNATVATIEYGETSNYGSEMTVTTSKEAAEHSVKLDDLLDGTKYHLRIVAEDEEGNVFSSDDYEFETLPVPKVTGVKLQQVRGAPTSTVRLAWGSNTGISSIVTYYPKGKPDMAKDQISLTLSKVHQMVVRELLDDTDYIFVIKGKDVGGNEATAELLNFKTSVDLRPPQISEIRTESTVTGVGDGAKTTIVVSWNTDEGSSAQVEYGEGTGGDYPNRTQEDSNLTANHTVTITDLKPATVYHLRVVTKDKMSNQSLSYDNVVVTPKATKSALDLVVNSLSKSFTFFGGLSTVGK